MGRKPSLTHEIQARLLEAVEAGTTNEEACAYAGISERAFYEWIQKGEGEGREPYAQFAHAITHARAKGRAMHVRALHLAGVGHTIRHPEERTTHPDGSGTVTGAGDECVAGDWRAAAKYLACTDPDRWSERRIVESRLANAKGTGDAHVSLSGLTLEEVRRLAGYADGQVPEDEDE